MDTTDARIAYFWPKVRKGSGCWEWTAATDVGGYGVFNTGRRMSKAHRYSWIIANGAIPSDRHVLHRCDNRLCVRPSHLYLGTQQDNVADMDARGRRGRGWHPSRTGQEHQASRLSDETVAAIRAAVAAGGRQRHVAVRFGVSHTYVGMLVRGEKRV